MTGETIGPLLKRLRLDLDRSQLEQAEELAKRSGTAVDRNAVSRWEREERLPGRFWLPHHAAALGVPVDTLRRAVAETRRKRRLGGPELVEEDDPLDRRAFLSAAVATTALPVLPALPAGKLGERVGPEHVGQLRTSVAALDALDDAYGGDEVRTLALRHLARVRRLVNGADYGETIGMQLQEVAGELSERCGWLSFDSYRHQEALAHWGEALTVADVVGSQHLRVTVLASMALQHIAHGRPRDGLHLLQAAQRTNLRGADSPAMASLLKCRESRALCRVGDRAGSVAAMNTAVSAFDRTRRDPDPEWVAFHGPAELAFAQGLNHVDAGELPAAVTCLRGALTCREDGFVRNGYLYRVSLAEALIGLGAVDEACGYAHQVVTDLPEIASVRVHGGLGRIAKALEPVEASIARDTVDMIRTAAREGTA
jgi:transcriptional regulator with XRE-family HTH domain